MRLMFVHLNQLPPRYLLLNIQRCRNLFPSLAITLVVSKGYRRKLKRLEADIEVLEYSQTQNDVDFEKSSHEKNFRSNFWRTSLERLLAIADLHSSYPNESILHIESDILLFPGFPLEIFKGSSKLVWQNYNTERDVASLLYSPDSSNSSWLRQQLVNLLNEDAYLTDMTALIKIRTSNPSRILLLPTLPVSSSMARNLSFRDESIHSQSFLKAPEGLFDSAQFGMWLFGMDSRNHYGTKILHSLTNIESGQAPFDPRKVFFESSTTGELRISDEVSNLAVFSMHVHSKDESLFDAYNAPAISNYIDLSTHKHEIRLFSAKQFLKLLLQSLLSNRFPQFVIGLPYIYKRYMKFRQVLRKHLKK